MDTTLYVCHGDDEGPSFHPCRRVQEALRAAGVPYEKTIAGHGHPIPFLRKGTRDKLQAATGTTKLPTLRLADGTVLAGSKAILAWVPAAGVASRGWPGRSCDAATSPRRTSTPTGGGCRWPGRLVDAAAHVRELEAETDSTAAALQHLTGQRDRG